MSKRKEARLRVEMETKAKDFALEFAKLMEVKGPSKTAEGGFLFQNSDHLNEFMVDFAHLAFDQAGDLLG